MSFWTLHVQLTAKTGVPILSEFCSLSYFSLPLKPPHLCLEKEEPSPVLIPPELLRTSEDVCISLPWVNAGSFLYANGFIFRLGPLAEPHLSFPG